VPNDYARLDETSQPISALADGASSAFERGLISHCGVGKRSGHDRPRGIAQSLFSQRQNGIPLQEECEQGDARAPPTWAAVFVRPGVARTARPNVLLITADQWRGECLSALGHPVVRTPNLDALAADGMLFRNHFTQSAPCGPSRACLLTSMYAMNHRSLRNGTPLDSRFTNVALEMRRLGYDPMLCRARASYGADDAELAAQQGGAHAHRYPLDEQGPQECPRARRFGTGADDGLTRQGF
jgi:hypothetical protein